MSIYHKHHIVPKHAGGTDDPSNIIELTIEEHAEAHRKLFEEHGRWQDEIAWKTLSGQINITEAQRQAQKKAVSNALSGVPKSPEHIAKMKKSLTGVPKSPEHRAKISKYQKGRKKSPEGRKNIAEGRKKWKFTEAQNQARIIAVKKALTGVPKSEETKKRMSEAAKKRLPHSEETKAKIRAGVLKRLEKLNNIS